MMRAFKTMGALLLCASPVLAADPPSATTAVEKGDLWEVTAQMKMEGFAGPKQTHTVCAERNGRPPVGGEEQGCQMYDLESSGSKSSWKMKCDSPEPSTGEGEITRTDPGHYTGWMKIASSHGTMTMDLSGTKLGECDVAAAKKRQTDNVARAQAQNDAAVKQMNDALTQTCETAVTQMNLMYLTMQGGACGDPKWKAAFCSNLQTRAGFGAVTKNTMPAPYGKQDVATYCGANLDDIGKKLCAEAMNPEDLEFIGPNCPAQTAEIAKRECAGRMGTGFAGTKYGQFCGTYARETMSAENADKQEEKKPESAGKKAKKALKSIFP